MASGLRRVWGMTSLFTVLLSKRFAGRQSATRRDSGQSLIETAFTIPFLLLIALNAINFGYFFFTAINVAAAPREAVKFVLNHVDIVYQVKPLIPGRFFGITLLPTFTFHRQVSMRQLN